MYPPRMRMMTRRTRDVSSNCKAGRAMLGWTVMYCWKIQQTMSTTVGSEIIRNRGVDVRQRYLEQSLCGTTSTTKSIVCHDNLPLTLFLFHLHVLKRYIVLHHRATPPPAAEVAPMAQQLLC
jgi:hypothetical protein